MSSYTSTNESPCTSSTNGLSNPGSNQEETKLLSFNRFAVKKSEERQAMSFRPKAKKARKMEAEEVNINIGVMVNKRDGDVQTLRGKSLPLRIKKGASGYDILEAAIKKRKDYDRSFRADRDYKLAYTDGSEVINIPGTDEPFTLVKYKEELGKSYARISLFLLYKEDVEPGIFSQDSLDSFIGADMSSFLQDDPSVAAELLEETFEETLPIDNMGKPGIPTAFNGHV